MSELQKPSVGRIVHYQADVSIVAYIDAMISNQDRSLTYILGPPRAQSRLQPGQTLSFMITIVNEDGSVNGQVFVDGNFTIAVAKVTYGTEFGQWQWPPRV